MYCSIKPHDKCFNKACWNNHYNHSVVGCWDSRDDGSKKYKETFFEEYVFLSFISLLLVLRPIIYTWLNSFILCIRFSVSFWKGVEVCVLDLETKMHNCSQKILLLFIHRQYFGPMGIDVGEKDFGSLFYYIDKLFNSLSTPLTLPINFIEKQRLKEFLP